MGKHKLRGKSSSDKLSSSKALDKRLVYSTDDQAAYEAEEDFANKPFKKLKNCKLASSKKHLNKLDSIDRETERDRQMFLKAALNVPPPSKKIKAGFLLAEQCSLPVLKQEKKKRLSPQPEKIVAVEPKREKDVADEDQEAFFLAMRQTKPLSGKGRVISPRPELKKMTVREQAFEELLSSQMEFTLLYSDEYLEGKVASLDEMLMNRLREGYMSPEAHLDLHGLNAEQAFEALRFFMRDAWFKGLRVVLLVTGRGKNSPLGQSILRRKVQEWLTHEPFKRVVLAFCTAKARDGGPGSIYVLLRKFRKKGHISWNQLAPDADLYDF